MNHGNRTLSAHRDPRVNVLGGPPGLLLGLTLIIFSAAAIYFALSPVRAMADTEVVAAGPAGPVLFSE